MSGKAHSSAVGSIPPSATERPAPPPGAARPCSGRERQNGAVPSGEPADAHAALAAGRWDAARAGFEQCLERRETPEECFGLAVSLWWLGENHASVERCSRAYSLFRASGDVPGAVRCAVWLAITYKANFANPVAANGWLNRAERLLSALPPGPLHGWLWIARAYRLDDLRAAEELSARAAELARDTDDVDLELVALSQLGLVRVGQGQTVGGFALIDEAMAAALAGEPTRLDTVVYACCDMLNACELASDLERAAQWCTVADHFVAEYGCPFLYAECRIYYGSVLAAKGRWGEAERELHRGLRITDGTCPGLHTRALTRLASLRIRQGRLDEAGQLLGHLGDDVEAEAEEVLSVAALLLARGEAPAAGRHVEQRLHDLEMHRSHLAAALELLVDARLATGELAAGAAAAQRLGDLAALGHGGQLRAVAAGAAGRVASARGDASAAVAHLEEARRTWSRLERPFELARARFDIAVSLATSERELAIGHARRALASFETLGAGLDADRAAAFLRSLGVNARTGAKGVGLLTTREQEVLRLLGAGHSNPEIAARLHVSRKTASHHVSSILTKLTLRNRAEAAAYAVGVLGPPAGPPAGT